MDPIFDQRRYLIPFRGTLLPQIFCDTLVIGGGVAGLRAAIAAADQGEDGEPAGDVIVLAKGDFAATNTAWAQGGVAAVLPADQIDTQSTLDSFDAHTADTMTAGAGLCDQPAVETIVREGAERIAELIDWGIRFDLGDNDKLSPGREGGHTASRIYHTDGDATGREFQRLLLERVRATTGIRLFTRCFALDLITPSSAPGSPCLGAITHHPRYGLQMIWARTTVLASGGAGQVYRETSNPRPATADGLAMAYRAGATLSDMAFVQFHPTTLYLPGANRALISEAVRGEGGHLAGRQAGERFMFRPITRARGTRPARRGEPRHRPAPGGDQETPASHLDLAPHGRTVKNFAARFPGLREPLLASVRPGPRLADLHSGASLAAHYMVGGLTDGSASGGPDVPGLYAAGEVTACTGLHGANRLASNSLLEGLVMGERAGRLSRAEAESGATARPTKIISDIPPSDHGELDLTDVRSSVRSAMWRNIGIERTASRLRDAGDMFDFWGRYTLDKVFDEPAGWETQNMLLVAALIARSALWREESRGCHWRDDHPEPSDAFCVHDTWQRGRGGCEPVPVSPGPLTPAPAETTPAETAPTETSP